jgi:hypothetical protein
LEAISKATESSASRVTLDLPLKDFDLLYSRAEGQEVNRLWGLIIENLNRGRERKKEEERREKEKKRVEHGMLDFIKKKEGDTTETQKRKCFF